MIEPSLPDVRAEARTRRSGKGAKSGRCLPSAQVLTELAGLGPDLEKLAEDLRVRLSDPVDSPPPLV